MSNLLAGTYFRAARSLSTRPALYSSTSNLSASLLRLPTSIRTFHASQPQQFIEPFIQTTHSILQTVHSSTSLPWYAILPLVALSARLFITLPVTIYTRNSHQRQFMLQPLLVSWMHQIRRDVMKTHKHLGPGPVEKEVKQRSRIKRRQLYRHWSCGYWKNMLPLVQLPIWLLVIENVRGMCGAKQGILGMFSGVGRSSDVPVAEGISQSAETDLEIIAPAAELLDSALSSLTNLIPVEPSMATEGCLWFTDLSVSDPLLLLPFMLSGALFLNLLPSRRKTTGVTQTKGQIRLTRSLQVFALAVGPMTLNMPTGMLLYWISSSTLAFVQGVVLDRVMPLERPVMPCKVPPPKGLLKELIKRSA